MHFWDIHAQGEVLRIVTHKQGVIQFIPTIVVNVDSVEVFTRCQWPIGERAVFISDDVHGKLFAESCVDQFNCFVSKDLAEEVFEGVFKQRPWHRHSQIIGWGNSDNHWVWKKYFLSVVKLSDHVVHSRNKTGDVEGSWLNHRTSKGALTDKQSSSVHGSNSLKGTSSLKRCIHNFGHQSGHTLRSQTSIGDDFTIEHVGGQ